MPKSLVKETKEARPAEKREPKTEKHARRLPRQIVLDVVEDPSSESEMSRAPRHKKKEKPTIRCKMHSLLQVRHPFEDLEIESLPRECTPICSQHSKASPDPFQRQLLLTSPPKKR